MKRLTCATVGVAVLLGLAVAPAWAEDGAALFAKRCASCHGAAGKGDGPASKALKTKPQDFATGLKGMSDADITKVIKEGVVHGATSHPKAATLSDEQVKSLIDHVKTFAK